MGKGKGNKEAISNSKEVLEEVNLFLFVDDYFFSLIKCFFFMFILYYFLKIYKKNKLFNKLFAVIKLYT